MYDCIILKALGIYFFKKAPGKYVVFQENNGSRTYEDRITLGICFRSSHVFNEWIFVPENRSVGPNGFGSTRLEAINNFLKFGDYPISLDNIKK